MANEKRLIDTETVIRKLRNANCAECNVVRKIQCSACWVDDVVSLLEDAPAVDAVEVVHGHWCWEGRFKACSNCGSYVEWDETLGANFWKFCPYCGAKMDGGNDDG